MPVVGEGKECELLESSEVPWKACPEGTKDCDGREGTSERASRAQESPTKSCRTATDFTERIVPQPSLATEETIRELGRFLDVCHRLVWPIHASYTSTRP